MGKTLRKAPLLQNENNDLYCIDILYKSLQEFHIPEYLCSVGEYAEEAICLEKSGSDWIVYGGERGQNTILSPLLIAETLVWMFCPKSPKLLMRKKEFANFLIILSFHPRELKNNYVLTRCFV